MREIAKRFLEDQNFTKEEFEELLKGFENKEERAAFREKAAFLRGKYYGDKVFTRGLIEFTNYCKNNCYYCGIRGGNKHVVRYRLTKEEILECCKEGYALGFRTFVLQGLSLIHISKSNPIFCFVCGNSSCSVSTKTDT